MLDKMRGASKSWAAKVLMGLLVLSFGVWGIADVFRFGGDSTLATVGDQEISAQDFENYYRRWLDNYQRQTGQTITRDMARQLGLDRAVLNEMMQNASYDAEASRLKLAISDQQIADEIKLNPAFHNSKGEFDPGLFREILERSGFTEAGFIASERQRFLRAAIAETTSAPVGASKTMTEAMHKYRNEERDARYFVVRPADSEVPKPSDTDLKTFYESNAPRYTAPEYRGFALMKVEPQDIAAKIEVTDAEIKDAYEKYKLDYFTPETRTVLQIVFPTIDEAKKAKERIGKGEDFLAIAKEHGLTEADATLGTVTKDGIIDEIIAEEAFRLAEGAVSDPVQGKLSIVLLKVSKVNPEKQATLDEVKDKLKERVQLEKARTQVQDLYTTVEDARAQQQSFEDIAKANGLTFLSFAAVDAAGKDKDGKPVEIPYKEDVLKQVYETDAGVENDALSLHDGFFWYEVREVIPSAVKPFDTVKAEVENDWRQGKVREVALEKAKKTAERARNGTQFDALAQENQAEIKTVQGLKRNETTADFDAPAVSALFAVPQNGFAFAPEPDGKGAKVIQSQTVLTPAFDANDADSQKIAQELAQAAGGDVLGLYVADLQADLGATVNETLWSRVTGANAN
ncbi:MAG: SurA N-terminal domain-containing protein [Parvibaculaceae bacterium]